MTPEQKVLFDRLTELQQRTATNVLAGMSQRQAYYAAGGSATSDESADATVHKMLCNAQVKEFMDSMKESALNDAIMSRTEALEKLSLLARTDLKDLVDFGDYELGEDAETGKPIIQSTWRIKSSALQDPKKMAAISELTAGKDGLKIKTHNQLNAMKQLAEMLGWDAAKKVDNTVRVVDDESNQW